MNTRRIVTLAVLALAAVVPGLARAEPGTRVIEVPGLAAMSVSPDVLEIEFSLETEHDTFTEAQEAAESMSARLGAIDAAGSGVAVDVDYDLTFLKQGGLWGRNRKLTHRFVMSVSGIQDGQVKRTLVRLIDQALELDSKLTVAGFEARLSESRSSRVRQELFRDAVRSARHNAEVLADAAQLRIVGTHRIGVRSAMSADGGLFERAMAFGRAARFSVDDDLTSMLKLSAELDVSFDVEPAQ